MVDINHVRYEISTIIIFHKTNTHLWTLLKLGVLLGLSNLYQGKNIPRAYIINSNSHALLWKAMKNTYEVI